MFAYVVTTTHGKELLNRYGLLEYEELSAIFKCSNYEFWMRNSKTLLLLIGIHAVADITY